MRHFSNSRLDTPPRIVNDPFRGKCRAAASNGRLRYVGITVFDIFVLWDGSVLIFVKSDSDLSYSALVDIVKSSNLI